MSECEPVRESLPLLLTESLDPVRREAAHLHVESCSECAAEWAAMRDTWRILGDVPQLEVPPRVRERFLAQVAPAEAPSNVVPFVRRPAVRWLSQAAAVALIAGGSWFIGHRNAPVRLESQPATIASARPLAQPIYSIAETRVLPAKSISPDIEGRPNINNVQFVDSDARDGQIGVAFDITSHVTVTGSPTDKSMVRLLSYVLQSSDDSVTPDRSRTIDWVRQTYSNPSNADPEIAQALAKVLRNTEHEGVRIKAAETLVKMPTVSASGDTTRDAIIEALKNDPNPAVRIKAVEALAKLASSGQTLDTEEVDTLRQKAGQDGENLYVRVKAAEALSKIRPQ